MAVEITSPTELAAWLEDKPSEWSKVIALRTALRVLPIAYEPLADGIEIPQPPLLFVRAVSLASGAIKYRASPDSLASIGLKYLSPSKLRAVALRASGMDTSLSARHTASYEACYSAMWAVLACAYEHSFVDASVKAVDDALSAVIAAESEMSSASILECCSVDCTALESGVSPQDLVERSLWEDVPNWFEERWAAATRWMSYSREGFEIWREWYFGRLNGLRPVFKSFNEVSDNEFYSSLIGQGDDWWSRDPADVNADIKALVDGLRNSEPPTGQELEQNPRAITFRPTKDGQVGLNKQADPSKLDTSEEAVRRHAEALSEATAALAASALGATQALDVAKPLDKYIEALGDGLDGTMPSLLVARGEKLRRLIASRENSSSSAIPFSENQEGALQDWMVAHNLLIGSDPYLAGIEHMARGPDAPVVVLELEALKKVIQSAIEAGLPTVEASEALEDSAANIPENTLEGDRRSVQATEAVKNFIRGVGSSIKAHGWKVAIGAGGSGYAGALWVQRNIEWLRELFINEPSILSVLEKIAALPL